MARFGQGMINSLINPSYAQGMNQVGLMAGSLPGKLRQEEYEREKLRTQQAAQASMNSLLNQSDPNDPNTMNAATKMGLAYGLDPNATQDSIVQAQVAAREREKMEMKRTEAKFRAKENQWKEEKKQREQEQQQVAQFVETAIARNPEKMDAILLNVPEEHRAFAREQAKSIQEYQKGVEERRERMLSKQELTSEELSTYEEVVGKDAIEAYNIQKRATPGAARKRLEDLYNTALKTQITEENKQRAISMKPPTKLDVELMETMVERELGSWAPWAGIGSTEKARLAYAAAAKRRTNPEWAPTKANLQALQAEIEGVAAEVAEEAVSDITKPDDVDQAAWDAMPPEDKALFK